MKTIQTLYPVLFPEKLVLKQLNKDLEDGLEQTKKAMLRLGITNGSVENLIQKEIDFHGGDIEKCKDRKTSGVISVLWLNRIMWFITSVVMNITNKTNQKPIKDAYMQTLRRYHGFVSSTFFDTMLRVCTSSDKTVHNIRSGSMEQFKTTNSKLHTLYLKNFGVFMKTRTNFIDKF
jgi:hypothetical protein